MKYSSLPFREFSYWCYGECYVFIDIESFIHVIVIKLIVFGPMSIFLHQTFVNEKFTPRMVAITIKQSVIEIKKSQAPIH